MAWSSLMVVVPSVVGVISFFLPNLSFYIKAIIVLISIIIALAVALSQIKNKHKYSCAQLNERYNRQAKQLKDRIENHEALIIQFNKQLLKIELYEMALERLMQLITLCTVSKNAEKIQCLYTASLEIKRQLIEKEDRY